MQKMILGAGGTGLWAWVWLIYYYKADIVHPPVLSGCILAAYAPLREAISESGFGGNEPKATLPAIPKRAPAYLIIR